MIRPIATELALFLTPFALYLAFLFASGERALQPAAWQPRRVAGLLIAALLLMIGSFVIFANFSGAPPGTNLPSSTCAGT